MRSLHPRISSPRRKRSVLPVAPWLAAASLLVATAAVSGELTVEPASLDFGIVKPASQQRLELTLRNPAARPVQVLGMELDCSSCVQLTLPPQEIAAGGELKVPVTLHPGKLDTGLLTRHLTILTAEKKQAKLRIPLQALVTASAAVWPIQIRWAAPQAPGADLVQELAVVNISEAPLRLLYAVGPLEGPKLTFDHTPIAGGGKGKLTATWHLPARPGSYSGQLVLFTDHPELTKLVLPYQVQVAAVPASAPASSPAPTPGPASAPAGGAASRPAAPPLAERPPATSPPPVPTSAPAATQAVEMIQLELRESLPLKEFVEIVAGQLKLNLLYDDGALNAPVSLHLAGPLPADAFLPLLKTVLQAKGLALVATERPEIWRIVTSREAQSLTDPGRVGGPEQVVTEFVRPQSVDLETAAGLLRSFLTAGVGQITPVPSAKALIVTDYSTQLGRLHRLLDLIDKPQAAASVEVVPLQAAEAAPLIDRLGKLQSQLAKVEGKSDLEKVFINAAEDGRSLLLVGPSAQLPRMTALIQRFDVAPALLRVDYPLGDAQRTGAVETIRQILGTTAADRTRDGLPRLLLGPQKLSVLATEGQHRRIKELLGTTDAGEAHSLQLRAYRILNRDATEIQGTLTRLLNDSKTLNATLETSPSSKWKNEGLVTTEGIAPVGQPVPPTPPVASTPPPPPPPSAPILPGSINLTVDAATNTLLIAAPAELHRKLQSLIDQLDRKQAQVLLEVMLVSVADSDTLAYAVDAAVKASIAGSTLAIGTDAGISKGDFVNGRTPTVNPGLNAAIFNPSSFSVFMNALAKTNSARVTSFPQVLALDNKAAMLRSLQQEPFTSVNASTTVATTSFGGFAEAGTTLELTPHIGPADYLNLEYRLEVSSFTGGATQANGASIPPPRRSDALSSFVSVPDGSTVLVGGLQSSSMARSVSKVPGLGDIPLLGLLGRNQNDLHSTATFYVFVRPTILRAARFEDLKFVSAAPRQAAGVPGDFPESPLRFIP